MNRGRIEDSPSSRFWAGAGVIGTALATVSTLLVWRMAKSAKRRRLKQRAFKLIPKSRLLQLTRFISENFPEYIASLTREFRLERRALMNFEVKYNFYVRTWLENHHFETLTTGNLAVAVESFGVTKSDFIKSVKHFIKDSEVQAAVSSISYTSDYTDLIEPSLLPVQYETLTEALDTIFDLYVEMEPLTNLLEYQLDEIKLADYLWGKYGLDLPEIVHEVRKNYQHLSKKLQSIDEEKLRV